MHESEGKGPVTVSRVSDLAEAWCSGRTLSEDAVTTLSISCIFKDIFYLTRLFHERTERTYSQKERREIQLEVTVDIQGSN